MNSTQQAHPLLVATVAMFFCLFIPVVGWALLPFVFVWWAIILILTIFSLLSGPAVKVDDPPQDPPPTDYTDYSRFR